MAWDVLFLALKSLHLPPIAALFAIILCFSDPTRAEWPSDSKVRMDSVLAGYRAANSIGFLGGIYFEITDSTGIQAGFGVIRDAAANKFSAKKTRREIYLNGRTYGPEQALKVMGNGLPGTPDSLGWSFPIERGRIRILASSPLGAPESAIFEGDVFDIREIEGRKELRRIVKRVPEALTRFEEDIQASIRYFNSAPEGEFVARTDYREGTGVGYGHTPAELNMDPAQWPVRRLALNTNDIAALAAKALAFCKDGNEADAELAIQAMAKIRPDYFRIPLARAACLERAGRRKEANEQIRSAMRGVWSVSIPDLLDRIEKNKLPEQYDSAYADQEAGIFWAEIDMLGIGLPQDIIGAGVSLHANLGPLAAAFSIGAGVGRALKPPAQAPAMNLRLFAPGRKLRFYLGAGAINPFGLGPKYHALVFGTEAGLSHDIGKPREFKMNYGLTWLNAIKRGDPEDGGGRSWVILPHWSLAYAF